VLNLPALYLHAEATNPDAIRLYESIGYKTERIQLRKEIM
jgi:ribosomal protein S18 acetylase RimI-like enzyme